VSILQFYLTFFENFIRIQSGEFIRIIKKETAMERREFFKKVIATPLLTPLFLAAKKRKSDCELHLITDDLQVFFPLILEELHNYAPDYGHSFALFNSHPQANALKRILLQRGLVQCGMVC